ncbi:hypothetical protein ACFW9L_36000 [Streptomyces sp. NPDC059517]|uniref:Imm32 family immunity protein n=1 Tax=Streptomyces sp. NPDC059517 TaxID=3346855 RepID=UPI0036D1679A
MRLVSDPGYAEVELSGSAEELTRLADAVARGEGLLSTVSTPGSNELTGAEVLEAPGHVLIRRDPERQILVISGDSASRAVLAENLLAMATAEDGGHLHIEHFPDHDYLAEGSLALMVSSPHGGMPTR